MKKLLLIVLLIVGCDKSTEPDNLSLSGKWQVTETENWYAVHVENYYEITDDYFIIGRNTTLVDEWNNLIGNCFAGQNFSYVDNNPNLILSYTTLLNTTPYTPQGITEYYLTYQISNSELNLQYLFIIINGDTTHCVDCYAVATPVNDIPDYDCP